VGQFPIIGSLQAMPPRPGTGRRYARLTLVILTLIILRIVFFSSTPQIAVGDPINTRVRPHDIASGIDPVCRSKESIGKINRAELAPPQEIGMGLTVGVVVPSHYFTASVDPAAKREDRAREIN